MSNYEVVKQQRSVAVRMSAELGNIDKASETTKVFLREQCLDDLSFDVLLVMREALANAVIHGCSSDSGMTVDYGLEYDGARLHMRVADSGPGFKWKKASVKAPQPELPGGRGLNIMRHYFDAMEYNERGNELVLTKLCQKGTCMSEVQHSGDVAVVKPGRDIVSSMAQEFKTELKDLADKGVKELTVDLDGVEMIDSIGMGLLIAAHNSLAKNGGKLRVTNATEDILRLLRTMRLDKHFEVDAS